MNRTVNRTAKANTGRHAPPNLQDSRSAVSQQPPSTSCRVQFAKAETAAAAACTRQAVRSIAVRYSTAPTGRCYGIRSCRAPATRTQRCTQLSTTTCNCTQYCRTIVHRLSTPVPLLNCMYADVRSIIASKADMPPLESEALMGTGRTIRPHHAVQATAESCSMPPTCPPTQLGTLLTLTCTLSTSLAPLHTLTEAKTEASQS